MAERVISYIDGFNLYFGLKEKGWRRLYWLDIEALSSNLLVRNQALVETKYFTSKISAPAGKAQRQAAYLDALQGASGCLIVYGRYQSSISQCPNCKCSRPQSQEKMTETSPCISFPMPLKIGLIQPSWFLVMPT